MARRSAPLLNRCVANEWRNACGVALSGSPSAPRNRAMSNWMLRALSGPPFRPRKSGALGATAEGTQLLIGGNRLARDRKHRHESRLAALAGDHHGIAGEIIGGQRHGFGNAQAAAIEKCEHGGVARRDPGQGVAVIGRFRCNQPARGFGAQGLRHGMGDLGRAQGGERRILERAGAFEKEIEGAQGRELARQ